TANRDIQVVLEDASYTRALDTGSVLLSAESQKFEYPFAPAQDQNLALKFLLGNTASSPGGPHTVSIANVVLEVKDAPVKRPPALTADSTDNKVGQSIRITFRDDAAWRAAITAVKIDGEVIDSSR